PAAAGDAETGTGGSSSGFVIHPDGIIATDAGAPRAPRERPALEAELRRNGAKAALARHVEAEALRAAAREGKLESVITTLALGATLEDVRVVDEVELANGTRLPYRVVATAEPVAGGQARVSLLRVERRNLPSLEPATAAGPEPGTKVWVVGYQAIATRSDDALGVWVSQEADLEAAFNPGEIIPASASVSGVTLVQTNAAIYEGNTGGAVIRRDDGRVVGVAFRGTNEQRKFVLSIDSILPMLDRQRVKRGQRGQFQETYSAALDAAERGDWTGAREQLAKADALFPNFPDLVRLRSEAERHEKESGGIARAVIPIAILGALLLGAIAAYALLRRGLRRKPRVRIPEVTRETDASPLAEPAGGEAASPLGSFIVVTGAREGERIRLSGPVLLIGREASACDLVFDHPKVSRVHAELLDERGRTTIVDRDSSNGTWVNGEKISRRILKDGDIIYCGGPNAVILAFNR
ncbi:MAG: FHA domain-containing protein, partial [Thermoanaerobaculia bacterium]